MKKFKKHIMVSAVLLIILVSSVPVFAQKKQVESEKVAKAETADTLTNADIIQMAKQKLTDAIIIQKINYSKCKFDTSPDALNILNKSGVSEQVILAMMENTAVSKTNPTSVSVLTQKSQEEKKTKFGIGFQGSYPGGLGISGILDVTPNVSIQVILAPVPLGDQKMYAGKGLYRVIKTSAGDFYAYGMIGAWNSPIYGGGLLYMNTKEGAETAMGFEAGIGGEANLGKELKRLWASKQIDIYSNRLSSILSHISLNVEFGIRRLKFKEADNPLLPISTEIGMHYRF